MNLNTNQRDRAVGALIGLACADALGAPYEFQPARINGEPVVMAGGRGWQPGEWTDDTAMAYVIAEVAATGIDLGSTDAQDAIVRGWVAWSKTDIKDIGIQTSALLRAVEANPTASAATALAAQRFEEMPKSSAGNGSLMRTAPVALAFLEDPDRLWQVAQEISALTHGDPAAGEACALWCMAIRSAVLGGTFDGLKDSLSRLSTERREYWQERIAEAEANPPHYFEEKNPWVVAALQAAWSAVVHAEQLETDPLNGVHACQNATNIIELAVRAGHDTDTVGAIAGMLAGAKWGVSGLPVQWQLLLHDHLGHTGQDLFRLAQNIIAGGALPGKYPDIDFVDISSWPYSNTRGELLPGLMLGGQQVLRTEQFDAAVSLCRIGQNESQLTANLHARIWVMDQPEPEINPNLHFLFDEVADLIHGWLGEGKRVLLHCVQAQNRTPAFATAYLMRHHGLSLTEARARVLSALPDARPNGYLKDSLNER